MSRSFLWVSALFLLSAGILPAQVLTPSVEEAEVGFSEVSDKFVRNMKLLSTLIQEKESVKLMNAVTGQAVSLGILYRSGNSDTRREEVLKRKDMMLERDKLKDADQKRLLKMAEELRKMDPDGEFIKGKNQVMQTAMELQKNLGLIYTTDIAQKDLIRIVQQHVNFYTACLSKLN
jgi:hypothetical protein